ncbi:type III secretion system stator protein SctL [Bremerella sp. JC770]|uniref:type III secretion system stator protein SctL n=1 Tax=Bremerella sp. JC770 TaxID=3232137 RepID=UPI003457CC9D
MLYLESLCDHLPEDAKIIKGDRVSAASTADQIVASARQTAAQIEQDAKAVFEQEKHRGYEEGCAEADRERQKLIVDTLADVSRYYAKIELGLVSLIEKALQQVLGDIDLHEKALRAIQNSLAWARQQSTVTVRVAPTVASHLRSQVENMKSAYPSIEILDVEEDAKLEEDRYILETNLGAMDVGTETQVLAILKTLTEALTSPNADTYASGNRSIGCSIPDPPPKQHSSLETADKKEAQ